MAKKLIRLTEGDLHRIIENSVHKVLNELDNRTVAGYIEGREDQMFGTRPYSDAMKRRGMRDFYNDKWSFAENPKKAAYLNAQSGENSARLQYGLGPFSKASMARGQSTYKNGKWGYDPSKFDDYK